MDSETGLDLYGLWAAPDGREVRASGDDGVIVASHDGGRTWRQQSSGTVKDVVSPAFTQDTRHG